MAGMSTLRYLRAATRLVLDGKWQQPDKIGILMGDETTHRTWAALLQAVKTRAERQLDDSIEGEKETDLFSASQMIQKTKVGG